VTKKEQAEIKLTALQRLIRQPTGEGDTHPAMTRVLPGKTEYLGLTRGEVQALEAVKSALETDLRFEHLRDPDQEVWRFIARCWEDRSTDHVPGFVADLAREPEDATCYVSVEHLSIAQPLAIAGVTLLPLDDSRIPARPDGLPLEPPIASVAAVPVRGTNYGAMAERARAAAIHALRVLRLALREHPAIHDRQLRFRVGTQYAFDARLWGWHDHEDRAYDLEMTSDLVDLLDRQPLSHLPLHPMTDIERKADLAARWMERAWLTSDPLTALLFLFFALEALLGDKSEGLKAHGLAFRQTMLAHLVDGHFSHPNATVFLYERARSAAVHGEDPPGVEWRDVQLFATDVRRSLNQYLTVAEEERLSKRARLLRHLDDHPDRAQLITWLREGGGPTWTSYLNELDI
jgi:hypothetical protein